MIIAATLYSMLLVVLLFVYTIRKGSYGSKTQMLYIQFLLVLLAESVLNIILIKIDTANLASNLMINLLKTYLLSILCAVYMFSKYVLTDINKNNQLKNSIVMNRLIFVIGLCVTNFCTLDYELDDKIGFRSWGWAFVFLFLLSYYFIIYSFVMINKHKQEISSAKCRTTIVWFFIISILLVTQLMLHNIATHGFLFAIGALVVFIEVESPMCKLDRDTETLNIYALLDCLRTMNNKNKDYKVFLIQLVNDDYADKAMMALLRKYTNRKKIKVFKDIGYDIYFVIENADMQYINYLHREIRDLLKLNDSAARFTCIEKIPEIDVLQWFNYLEVYKMNNVNLINEVNFIESDVFKSQVEFNEAKALIIDAIDNDRVEIFIQPIYSVTEDRFVSAEVLCRLFDSTNNLIAPSEFIDVAEKSGLILELEDIIFEKSCRFIKEGKLKNLGVEYLEINLSVVKGESDRVRHHYYDILRSYNIDPSMIVLEITETLAVTNKHAIIDNMNKFKELGFNFALDDFGTGESNLEYILDMPATIVKFDKDMTHRFFLDRQAKIVLTIVAKMVKSLGLKVVVEGIETEEQLNGMLEIGVDYIQGYYFSEPLPKQEFIKFLEHENIESGKFVMEQPEELKKNEIEKSTYRLSCEV